MSMRNGQQRIRRGGSFVARKAYNRLNRIFSHMALASSLSPFVPATVNSRIRYAGLSSISTAKATLEALKPEVGSSLEDLHTPALVVIKENFERNLKTIHEKLPEHVSVRPHVKAHKSPVIGRMQLEAGAQGLCAAKLSEAEVLVAGGCLDVCITNEVIGKRNLRRLASLAKKDGAVISVCVDSKENIEEMASIMKEENVKGLGVLIEVNVGQNRCGVEPGMPAADLAHAIAKHQPWLEFLGLHAYHGSNQHVRDPLGREGTVKQQVAPAVQSTLDAIKSQHDIDCKVVTGGGTGSYPFEVESGLYTEIQPGSYIFMDVDYSKNLQRSDRQPGPGPFLPSLFILTTVVSVSTQGWAVVDAGMKAVSLDSGAPRIYSLDFEPQDDSVEYICGGDEHGIIKPRTSSQQQQQELAYKVGDLLLLQPGHCDPTVNLYDYFSFINEKKGEEKSNRGSEKKWVVSGNVAVAARGPGL
eukprot:jgi/Bigna1/85604/estExt_fgenesh1_pg.C_50043